jgi:hypothetical protein
MFNNTISKGKFALALTLAIALFAVVGTDQNKVKTVFLNKIEKEIPSNESLKAVSYNTIFCMGGVNGD